MAVVITDIGTDFRVLRMTLSSGPGHAESDRVHTLDSTLLLAFGLLLWSTVVRLQIVNHALDIPQALRRLLRQLAMLVPDLVAILLDTHTGAINIVLVHAILLESLLAIRVFVLLLRAELDAAELLHGDPDGVLEVLGQLAYLGDLPGLSMFLVGGIAPPGHLPC
jgi:hypothetical protein